jgi:hypothetical protein
MYKPCCPRCPKCLCAADLCVFLRAHECVGETDYMRVGWGVSVVCYGARVQVNVRTVLAGKALVVGVPDPRIMPWSQKPHFLQVRPGQ